MLFMIWFLAVFQLQERMKMMIVWCWILKVEGRDRSLSASGMADWFPTLLSRSKTFFLSTVSRLSQSKTSFFHTSHYFFRVKLTISLLSCFCLRLRFFDCLTTVSRLSQSKTVFLSTVSLLSQSKTFFLNTISLLSQSKTFFSSTVSLLSPYKKFCVSTFSSLSQS